MVSFFSGGYIYSTNRMTDASKSVISENVLSQVQNSVMYTVQATVSSMSALYKENIENMSHDEAVALVK